MEFSKTIYFSSKDAQFCLRPINASDKELLQKGFSELSERSRYLRFFYISNKLSDFNLKYLTEVDGIKHVAWGILDQSGATPIPAALGRFVKFKDEQDVAEIAITVIDSYQRKGLGRILFATLNIIAGQIGVKILRYHVHSENQFVLHSLELFGILKQKIEDNVSIMEIKVIPSHQSISDEPIMQTFKATMKMIETELEI